MPTEPTPSPAPKRPGFDGMADVLAGLPPELHPPAPDSPPGRILAAARELYATRGISGLSTRRLAEAAGVNLSLIHYYFGSKEGLVRAAIRGEILGAMADVFAGLDSSLPSPELFVQFPIRLLEVLRADAVRLRLLRRVLATNPERLTRAVEELGGHGLLGVREVMLKSIAHAQAEEHLPPLPPRSILLFLLSSAYGLILVAPLAEALLGFSLQDDDDWAEHRTQLAQLISGALGAGPHREVR